MNYFQFDLSPQKIEPNQLLMDRPFPARSWTLYYGAITNALVIFPLLYLIIQVHTSTLLMDPHANKFIYNTNNHKKTIINLVGSKLTYYVLYCL